MQGKPSIAHQQTAGMATRVRARSRGVRLKSAKAFRGRRLLASDLRVAFLLANEARYRTVERLLGVPRDQANFVTVIGLLVLADAVHEHAARALSAPGGPAPADAVLGSLTLRELLYGLGGPSSRDTPLFGTLITIGVIGGLIRPAVGKSIHGIRSSSQRMQVAFHQRYGHLIGSSQSDASSAR